MNTGDKIITLFSTGLYTGYFPLAPATFSTLTVGIVLYALLTLLPPALYGILTLTFVGAAVWLSDKSEKIFQQKDCRHIVIDELAGFLITMFLIPREVIYIVSGFLLFRLFDITKPPPAHFFNRRQRGGLDVVLDDVVAGVYANVFLWALHYYLNKG
jgi:phosphatidylglycerophosphatase A